ncbi:Purine nucleoside phosphorylase-like protein [Elsinoe fawcettii]|nr:Purine nucleoside phosphorylase-like protein [Elsinoe fawcettii]
MAAVTDQAPAKPASEIYTKATEAVSFIRSNIGNHELHRPRIAIVCGSGLGGIADVIDQDTKFEVPYSTIPHFPKTTVVGHAGKLVFGFMSRAKVPVVLLVGRAQRLSIPVTNAAGGLNPEYNVGDIVVLNDHLNLPGFAGYHPLRGPNADDFGVRFPPLSDAYDIELRRRAHLAWQEIAPSNNARKLREGVYAFLCGPTYETRAECRMMRTLGADLVV